MRKSIRSIAGILIALIGFAGGDALLRKSFKIVAVDPVSSPSWSRNFSPGDTRSVCVALVARRWLQLDLSAASAWIKTVPDAQSFSGNNNY